MAFFNWKVSTIKQKAAFSTQSTKPTKNGTTQKPGEEEPELLLLQ